jgi:hypothetical protein
MGAKHKWKMKRRINQNEESPYEKGAKVCDGVSIVGTDDWTEAGTFMSFQTCFNKIFRVRGLGTLSAAFVILMSTLGCRTSPAEVKWEYKTVTVYNSNEDKELNRLAEENWLVVGFSRNRDDGSGYSSTFVLKRDRK